MNKIFSFYFSQKLLKKYDIVIEISKNSFKTFIIK